nr:hypothetical protein [Nocardia abscessus]
MLAWALQWPERTWAVENAEGLGHHLAGWLVSKGEVVDVAPAATARIRQLSGGEPLEKITSQPEFDAEEISQEQFEQKWAKARQTPH